MGYPRDNHGIAIANSIVHGRGDLPTSFPAALPYVEYNGALNEARRITDGRTAAAATKHSHYPLIRIPGSFRNAPGRYYYCHYASSGIRHAYCSARNDLISREKRGRPGGTRSFAAFTGTRGNLE